MTVTVKRVDRPNILGDEWTALDNAEYSGKIGQDRMAWLLVEADPDPDDSGSVE